MAFTLHRSMKIRQSIFFAHLALEKMLKAIICQKTDNIAPGIHNLIRLSEIADLILTDKEKRFLMELNLYNLEGRYPGSNIPVPDYDEAEKILRITEETIKWLKTQLKK